VTNFGEIEENFRIFCRSGSGTLSCGRVTTLKTKVKIQKLDNIRQPVNSLSRWCWCDVSRQMRSAAIGHVQLNRSAQNVWA